MENIKELLHELRCDIACIPRSDDNKEEIKNATQTLRKAWDLVSKSDFLPCVSPREAEFKAALTLLRDLADIQNGAPLVTVEKEWNEIIDSTYDFLEQHEG